MLKHVWLIFGSTFILGLVLGGLLFFGSAGKETPSPESPASGFTIAVYTYGGCIRLECPQYRIQHTGEYIYIASEEAGAEGRVTGSIPLSERRALSTAIEDAELALLQETEFVGECPINVDGLGYRYDIEVDGDRFMLDSCVHALEGVQLFDMLNEYGEIFGATYASQ